MTMFNVKKSKLFVFCIVFLSLGVLSSCVPRNEELTIIPFTLENNRMVIYATVNGVEGRFMWDTGAFDSHTFSAASLENLTPMPNRNPPSIRSYYIENGIVINGQIIRSKSIINYIPSHVLRKWDNIAQYLTDNGFDGILGLAMFNGYWAEVSFSTSNIILHRRRPQGFTDFASARTTFRGLYYDQGRVFVTGIIDSVPVDFLLDTGVRDKVRFPYSILGYLGRNDYRKVLTLQETFFEFSTRSLSLMGNVFYDQTLGADYWTESVVDKGEAILGLDFLQRYDFLFNLRTLNPRRERTRLYYRQLSFIPNMEMTGTEGLLFWADFSPLYEIIDPSGIIAVQEEGFFEVLFAISPGFAHDELGLMPGMLITAINGQPAIGTDQTQLSEFLAYLQDGGEGELTVLDTDGTERVIVRRETECEIERRFVGLWMLENVVNRHRRSVVPYFTLFSNGIGSDIMGRFTWQQMDNDNILVRDGTTFVDVELSENGTLLTFHYSGRDYTGRHPQKAMYRRR